MQDVGSTRRTSWPLAAASTSASSRCAHACASADVEARAGARAAARRYIRRRALIRNAAFAQALCTRLLMLFFEPPGVRARAASRGAIAHPFNSLRLVRNDASRTATLLQVSAPSRPP